MNNLESYRKEFPDKFNRLLIVAKKRTENIKRVLMYSEKVSLIEVLAVAYLLGLDDGMIVSEVNVDGQS